jgi:Fibronectin type III domain
MAFHNPFANLSTTQKYVVAGGGLAIGVFALVQHHSKTGSWSPFATGTAATSNSSATGTDPITGMPYSDDNATDPITGQQYLAEAEQYGSVQAAEASVSAFGQSTASGSGIPVNPASPASSGSINTPVGSSVYTSNAAWAQAATAGLTDVGYSGTDVATALGDYLTQTPVTPAQATLINTAIAEYGPAPVGNLQVILQPTATASNTPPPATTTTTTPTSTTKATVKIPPMPGNLKSSGITANGFTLTWDKSTGATEYNVRVTYQGNVVFKDTTSATSIKVTGLDPDHTYTGHVSAVNSGGTSDETNGPAVKTSK